MRHKIHNTFSIFEPKRPYPVTRFSQKQGKIKVNNNIKWFNLEDSRVACKTKDKTKDKRKHYNLQIKKAVERSVMIPSWPRILIILLYLRHFFTSQISTLLRPS